MGIEGLVADFEARGLVHDCTDLEALARRLADGPVTVYHGIDPTADSLHVGHLVGVLALRRFQMAGHHAVALAGGATGMVGDPSGRSAERNLLDADTLGANVTAIKEQMSRLLGDDGEWTLVDNHEWTAELTLLPFLRDVGKHFTVNRMVAKESVRARMESEDGISFTEFSYMLLQAYDYLVLHERLGCELQIGGSDQWGNITAGIDLIRRHSGASVHGLTWPLVTRADGRAFRKSEGGDTPWLAAARTTPYRFFQFWIHTDDRDVDRYLRIFTFLDVEEIDAAVARSAEAPERREGQRLLARTVTAMVHGPDAAAAAAEASAVLFGAPLDGVSARALATLAAEVPSLSVARHLLEDGVELVELLTLTGLATSRSDAQRLIAGGGVYVNDRREAEPRTLGSGDLLQGRYMLLRKGKREYSLVEAV